MFSKSIIQKKNVKLSKYVIMATLILFISIISNTHVMLTRILVILYIRPLAICLE